jgi:uncharacterized membrane protein YjgN (DUF898 family)
VVALIMFVGYNISVRLHSWVTVFILVALALVMPWLLRNSFRFRLYNTSWRGTRFHFRGTVGAAYRVFLLYGALTLLTLYFLMPFSHQRLKAYQLLPTTDLQEFVDAEPENAGAVGEEAATVFDFDIAL